MDEADVVAEPLQARKPITTSLVEQICINICTSYSLQTSSRLYACLQRTEALSYTAWPACQFNVLVATFSSQEPEAFGAMPINLSLSELLALCSGDQVPPAASAPPSAAAKAVAAPAGAVPPAAAKVPLPSTAGQAPATATTAATRCPR